MIPNIFHFIFGLKQDFGGKPFALAHFLAIKSAHCVNQPDAMFLHGSYEPQGEWWEKAKPFLTFNKIDSPQEIFGNRLFHIAHQADVLRLQILREVGGIYLDIDTICVKPLRELYSLEFVIGQQLATPTHYGFLARIGERVNTRGFTLLRRRRIHGLCNAVMLAEKGSSFAGVWLDSYRTFRSHGRDTHWDEHSVKVPMELSRIYPRLLTKVSPYFFHFPLWDSYGLSLLFEKAASFPRAYLHHLWEASSWDNYLSKLSPEVVLNRDSTYSRIARRYLE